MNPEDRLGAAGFRGGEGEAWAEALTRLRRLGAFLRRRAWILLGSALGCAGAAAFLLAFVYPRSYSAHAVLAAEVDRGTSVEGLLRLPEIGYRMLAVSPEALDRTASRIGGGAALIPGRNLRIRLLDSKEVRKEGVARLLELSARAGDPGAAAELANTWADVLIEMESERAQAIGLAALKQASEERRSRQVRRIEEQRVRLRIAQDEARERPGRRAVERVEEERLQLRTEEALLARAAAEVERLAGRGGTSESGDGVATAVALGTLPDSRLEEVLDRLEVSRGSLSVFLPARPDPRDRTWAIFLRAFLAGLGGGLVGFLVAGFRELSSRP